MILEASVEPRLEYEIFKRDSFTCQQCGESTPKVVLFVGYKVPPSEGGTEDVNNLATYCYHCAGTKPLEMLSKRRQQLELMLEWKKSLEHFNEDTLDVIYNYVEEFATGRHLNDNGKKEIRKAVEKYGHKKVIDILKPASDKSIVYGDDGKATLESSREFIINIHKFLAFNEKSPCEKKIAYIKGICRNKFPLDWNADEGDTILFNYVEALKQYGLDEQMIAQFFDEQVIPRVKKCKSLDEWKTITLNSTSAVLERAEKEHVVQPEEAPKHFDDETLSQFTWMTARYSDADIEVIMTLFKSAHLFTSEFAEKLHFELNKMVYDYLCEQQGVMYYSNNFPSHDKAVEIREKYRKAISPYTYFGGEDFFSNGGTFDIPEGDMSIEAELRVGEIYFNVALDNLLSMNSYTDGYYDYDTTMRALQMATQRYRSLLYP